MDEEALRKELVKQSTYRDGKFNEYSKELKNKKWYGSFTNLLSKRKKSSKTSSNRNPNKIL